MNIAEIETIKNIWHNPRTTLPENDAWILCIEEGSYPRVSNHGVLSGTTQWAFVDELSKSYLVEFNQKDTE